MDELAQLDHSISPGAIWVANVFLGTRHAVVNCPAPFHVIKPRDLLVLATMLVSQGQSIHFIPNVADRNVSFIANNVLAKRA